MRALLFTIPIFLLLTREQKKPNAIACAPAKSAYQFKTVKAGNWSNPQTWNLQRLPQATDSVEINHPLILDTSVTIAGALVNSTLLYKTTSNVTLSSTKNIVVIGLFQMKPSTASYKHSLRFVGINQRAYETFTAHDVLPSNVGLWVTGSGKLDFEGTLKTPWTRLKASAVKGEQSTVLQVTPTGWEHDDVLSILPTEKTEADILGYDDVLLKAQAGTTVSFNKPLNHNHRIQNNKWTAEVLNLTRNVVISGGHIVIMSKVPQSIRYVSLEAMGARKDINGDGATELVKGVYAVHFHHSMLGSRGSIVEGCVARNGLSHSFVPHNSTGVTFRNNIAYNSFETAFWQDFSVNTDSILLESNVVAKPQYVFHALNTDKGPGDDDVLAFGVTNFFFGLGSGNVARENVSVGQVGDEGTHAAFLWEANNEGIWVFENNTAHNTYTGVRNWQTSNKPHTLQNTIIYNAIVGVFHGAYANSFQFIGGELWGCPFIEKANSQTPRIKIEKMTLGDLSFFPAQLQGAVPILVKDCIITGLISYNGRQEDQDRTGKTFNPTKNIDFVNCTIKNPIQLGADVADGEVIRVQNGTTAYQITKAGRVSIPPFHK